jgi:hypothetical protein
MVLLNSCFLFFIKRHISSALFLLQIQRGVMASDLNTKPIGRDPWGGITNTGKSFHFLWVWYFLSCISLLSQWHGLDRWIQPFTCQWSGSLTCFNCLHKFILGSFRSLEHPQCNRYIGPLNDSLTFESFIVRTWNLYHWKHIQKHFGDKKSKFRH